MSSQCCERSKAHHIEDKWEGSWTSHNTCHNFLETKVCIAFSVPSVCTRDMSCCQGRLQVGEYGMKQCVLKMPQSSLVKIQLFSPLLSISLSSKFVIAQCFIRVISDSFSSLFIIYM
jgi:hypothetical protein